MLGDLMNALMQSGSGTQQPQSNSGGGDMLSQVVGGLLGGGQQSGGAPINQLLGGLEQVIGGTPGTGQPMNMNQGAAMINANNPVMGMLQPVINSVAAKTGVPPEIATAVAGIAMHYLLSSHPAAGGNSSLNLGSMMQQISSGNVNMDTVHKSGMVKDVMQATGLSQQDAANALSATFNHLQGHVNPGGMKKVHYTENINT